MVGTLHCRDDNPVFESEYNDFVERRRAILDNNIAILKDHFQRESGEGGQIAYDRYSTVLANAQASKDYADPDTCAQVGMLLRSAASADDRDLLLLAQTVERVPESNGCPAGVALAATAPAPAAQPRLAAAQPAGAPPEALPLDTAPLPPAPPEHAKMELATPAAAPTPALASADSRDQAMQAAIAALQAATIALQSASTAPASPPPPKPPASGKPDVMKQAVPDSPVVPVNGNGVIE